MPHTSSEYRNRVATVLAATKRAEQMMLAEDYAGYDPYDALASPLFHWPLLRARLPRRVAQQLVKRSVVDVRPLLRIRKGRNPVTFGLGLQAWTVLAEVETGDRARRLEEIGRLVGVLDDQRSAGWSGACWGYDFDWETRDGTVPAHTPTIVATGFVTNALFTAHDRLSTPGALELCASATAFVAHDLERTPGDGDSFCWSYAPHDRSRVLNATAKGSRLLAQVGTTREEPELLVDARNSLQYVVDHQRADGSWPYAIDDPRSWADNFHTAYVLDSLDEYTTRTGDSRFADALEKGWRYYRDRFFDDGWLPRYYDSALYPIDATAVAQSMLTLCRFGDRDTALRIATWAVETLQLPSGGFGYRVTKRMSNRVHYMRWSTAWLTLALATVVAAHSDGSPESA